MDLDEITFYCNPDGTAVTDVSDSPLGFVMGFYAMKDGKREGWLDLAEGNVYLEPVGQRWTCARAAIMKSGVKQASGVPLSSHKGVSFKMVTKD